MSAKTKKILNIVVDVVVAIVLAFALFLAICTISSKAKGYDQYTAIFGKAYIGVRSDSMKGEGSDNFSKGDLIAIKLLDAKDTSDLKEGDIITFEDVGIIEGKRLLNTHRIKEVVKNDDGSVKHFITHGDNNPEGSDETVGIGEVVGIYTGKAGGIGHVLLFMNSSAGFFTCIVLPTLLIVAYFAVNLVLVIRKEKKAQTAQAEQQQADEREKIRQELLAEMQGQNTSAPAQGNSAVSDGGKADGAAGENGATEDKE